MKVKLIIATFLILTVFHLSCKSSPSNNVNNGPGDEGPGDTCSALSKPPIVYMISDTFLAIEAQNTIDDIEQAITESKE